MQKYWRAYIVQVVAGDLSKMAAMVFIVNIDLPHMSLGQKTLSHIKPHQATN